MARKNDMQRIADASAKLEASSPEYTGDQKLAARTLVRRRVRMAIASVLANNSNAYTQLTSTIQGSAEADIRFLGVYFIPSAALTADNTNYATISLKKADGTVIASQTTQITGSGNHVAGTRVPLTMTTTPANARVAKGGGFGPAVAMTAAGVALAAGTIEFDYELEGSMSDYPV